MPDTTARIRMTHAQTVASGLRAQLQRLGVDHGTATRVVPWADIDGRPTIHLPALPLDVAERVLAILTADAEATP